jgi:hypothetical protein
MFSKKKVRKHKCDCGHCKICYQRKYMKDYRAGKRKEITSIKIPPTCPHKDRQVYARGLCASCYQGMLRKGKKDGSFDRLEIHNRIPLWKIIKGLEEGKSGAQIAKENHIAQSAVSRICTKYGFKQNFKFKNIKTYKKMCRNSKWEGRIISVPAEDIRKAGFDPKKELFYRMDAKKNGIMRLKMFYEIPKGVTNGKD